MNSRPMSNIDKRALREAAERATSGKWERGDGNGNGGELLVYSDDALGSAVCEMTSEYNAIPKYQRINNLNFIAAANPATVLALLDELETKDKLIAELEVVNELFLRAKALMYQSGGTPIENSLNPIDAWLYDAERAAAVGKGEAS